MCHPSHSTTYCFIQSSILTNWKSHQITPIYESRDHLSVTNCRPIPFLCSTCKVLESLIYNNVIDFINPCPSKYQFWVLSNRSRLHKLLFSNVVQAHNNKYGKVLKKKSRIRDAKKRMETSADVQCSALLHP